ncbi:MAG: hypothetical protein Q4P36_01550 [Bowdeniella nasicola]|nr:hypothetical protein [Bowdeniella nasicola]
MRRNRRLLVRAVLVLTLAGIITVYAYTFLENTRPLTPTRATYVVLPHPDDEWQVWSQLEDTPDEYKIIVLMTRGEETAYCDERWSEECEQKRLDSFVTFFSGMSKRDHSIPGHLSYIGSKGPFPTLGYDPHTELTREDDGVVHPANLSADVWVDRLNRGALVVWDFGDGDLTPEEVTWAIKTTQDNREVLGVNPEPEDDRLIASYANTDFADCFIYDHPDHVAVRDAVYAAESGFSARLGATCASDPEASVTAQVSDASVQQAFGAGEAFKQAYGWLSPYELATEGQSKLFMRSQSFWVRVEGD